MSREIEFEHVVKAWTVGDLRKALEGVPDDVQLVIETAEKPGGDVAGPTQVVIAAAYVKDWIPPDFSKGESAGHFEDRRTTFQLNAEFPSGTYYKRSER